MRIQPLSAVDVLSYAISGDMLHSGSFSRHVSLSESYPACGHVFPHRKLTDPHSSSHTGRVNAATRFRVAF